MISSVWARDWDLASERIVPDGFLSDEELAAFSLLIDHRKSLPIFLGDGWRCYSCTFECTDFLDMADHIIDSHEPAPFNDEDYAERWTSQAN